MSSSLSPRYSHTKKFSREGFHPIPAELEGNMSNNDATIDIPLEPVTSISGGLRSSTSMARRENTQTSQEKQSRIPWHLRGRRKNPKADQWGRAKGKIGYDGEEETVNTMGKIYKTIMGSSAIVSIAYWGRVGACVLTLE